MKKRSNIELPARLVQQLKAYANKEELSPSQAFQAIIQNNDLLKPVDLQMERINLSWTEAEEKLIEDYQNYGKITRGGETFPITKHRVIEALLQKFFAAQDE